MAMSIVEQIEVMQKSQDGNHDIFYHNADGGAWSECTSNPIVFNWDRLEYKAVQTTEYRAEEYATCVSERSNAPIGDIKEAFLAGVRWSEENN